MKDPRLVARMMTLQDPGCLEGLWLKYWGNGGNAGKAEFEALLRSPVEWDAFELRILSWAIEDLSSQAA